MSYQPQVSKDHYQFDRYLFPGRWMSYYYQTKEILTRPEITSVLDVGPGTTFLRDVLKSQQPDLQYETLDVAVDLEPDHVGSVTDIPLPDNAYEAVCAFQVLEHIEYPDVPTALAEMTRVARKYVLISLPHFGPSLELQLKVPFMPRLRLATKLPWPRRHVFNGQHYWEIGKRGYSPRTVRRLLQAHGQIVAEYVPFEYQYHRFYIIKTL